MSQMASMITKCLAVVFWAHIASGSNVSVRVLLKPDRCYHTPLLNAALGQGGQGTVNLAYPSTEKQMKVALKKVKIGSPFSKAEIEFLQELSQAGSYRGVPRLFDVFKSDDSMFIVEQYFKGQQFHTIHGDLLFYRMSAQVWENRVMRLLYKITTIISQIHQSGYVHLDIKPDNILYDVEDNVIIIDFGSCLKIDTDNKRSVEFHAPSVSSFMTTEPFVAPELKARNVGYPNDIYSLGRTAANVLGNFPPEKFPRLSQFITMAQTLEPSERPTAEDILGHDLFHKERAEYGISSKHELPLFEQVINLSGSNAKYFKQFPLPQCDPGSSSSRKFSLPGFRRCFSQP